MKSGIFLMISIIILVYGLQLNAQTGKTEYKISRTISLTGDGGF